jgi:hypothetical protein
MSTRDASPQPFALRRTPAQARHGGGCARLVDEDQPFGVEIELALKPGLALLQHVGPVLFGGMRGLFLTVRPQRSRKVQIVPMLALTFRSAASRSCISARVVSGLVLIRPSRKARCASSLERRGWPWRRAVRSPLRRARPTQTMAVAIPTPKRTAARRAGSPASAASITRSRKSWL